MHSAIWQAQQDGWSLMIMEKQGTVRFLALQSASQPLIRTTLYHTQSGSSGVLRPCDLKDVLSSHLFGSSAPKH